MGPLKRKASSRTDEPGIAGLAIAAGEKIADRASPKGIPPASPAMLRRIVDHVAALAECGQIAPAWSAEAGIVVQMGRCKVDRSARHANCIEGDEGRGATKQATASIAPCSGIGVPPSPIPSHELGDVTTMRTPAMFAAPPRSLEADDPADLRPVDRIEPAMFRTDRHRRILNHADAERKEKIQRRH